MGETRTRGRIAWPVVVSVLAHAGALGAFVLAAKREPAGTPEGRRLPIGVQVQGREAKGGSMGIATTKPITKAGAGAERPTPDGGSSATPGAAGDQEGDSPRMETYAAGIRGLIESALKYPVSLRRRGITGRTELRLVIRADGRIDAPEVTRSSGSPDLDRLAVEAAVAAAPYPAPPEELRAQTPLSLALPVEFRGR